MHSALAQVKHVTEGFLEYQKYQKHASDQFTGKVHFDEDFDYEENQREDEEY